MSETFGQMLQSINNSEIRITLEKIFGLLGLQPGDSTGPSTLVGDVTGDLTGDVTGDVAGDLTGDVTGDVAGDLTGNVLAADAAEVVSPGATVAASTVQAGTGTFTSMVGDVTGSVTELVVGTAPANAVKAISECVLGGAAVPAVHAVSVFTSAVEDIADTKTVTIGATVYRFMTTPAQAYDVLRGDSTANSIDNLHAAINASGTGDGTDYFAGTLAHPTVYCSSSNDTTLTVQVRIPGDEQNTAVTETTDVNWTWNGADFAAGTIPGVTSAAATFTIGTRTYMMVNELSETNAVAIVDQILYGVSEAAALDNIKVALNAGATEGTNYSTGTVVNADVVAGLNTNTTQRITAKVAGVIGNAIATTETMANFAWTSTVMVGGVDGTVGTAGQVIMTATHLFMTHLANTIADAGWNSVSLEVFNNVIATPSITLTESLNLGETDFDSDVIFLDGSAALVVTDWTPTVGRTYYFECTDSTSDPVINLTSGITLDTAANDIMTFEDADDSIVLKCITATRLIIISNTNGVTLSS